MSSFQLGDRVRILSDSEERFVGKTGMITEITFEPDWNLPEEEENWGPYRVDVLNDWEWVYCKEDQLEIVYE